MATTKLNDVINPQVMGDMIEAKIIAQAKITPYAKVDDTLEGVPGDTVTVPSWDYIGDADDFDVEAAADTDKEIPTTNLTASSTTFTIKCAAKAVSVLQTAINSGKGNPIGQAETQLAKAIVAKVDNDVIAAAYTSKKTSGDGTAQISYAGIVDANTSFLDEEDGIEKVMFINPAQEATLLKDPNFLSADKFTAGVAVNGAIGKIAGAWIKKSKKVRLVKAAVDASSGTAVTADNMAVLQAKVDPTVKLEIGNKVKDLAAANQYYVCPVLKMEPDSTETEYTEDELAAITIFLKKNTQVDHEWFPKKQKHDITATKYYGVALTNTAKVVLAKFKK